MTIGHDTVVIRKACMYRDQAEILYGYIVIHRYMRQHVVFRYISMCKTI